MTLVVVGDQVAADGRLQADHEADVVLLGHADRSGRRDVLGPRRQGLLEHLRGTPFLPWVLRLFGAKIGKGVCMDITDITEFDCVTIGDFCDHQLGVRLQTHLYEDRVMKVGRIDVGRGVSVGAGATVLYDTQVGDFARLGPLTVVMKGESIPGHTEWEGAPAVPVVHQAEELKQAA